MSSVLKIIPKVITRSPKIIDKKKATEAMLLALDRFFSPRLLESKLPAPIPIIEPTACIIVKIEKTIPTAALALVPSFETKKMSVIPYKDKTSIETMVGIAIFIIAKGIGFSDILDNVLF